MHIHSLLALAFLLLFQSSLFGGSRGVSLAFLDATTGTRSEASLRLAELIEKDMREIYVNPSLASAFPWSEQELELNILKASKTGLSFDRLLNTKDSKKLPDVFEKNNTPDGLIVFFHDSKAGYVRLKLYSWDGTEAILLRLPLEKAASAMPDSLLKGHRRGALIALGAAVRWSP